MGKINNPGKWNKPHLNQGPLSFKQTNQTGHLCCLHSSLDKQLPQQALNSRRPSQSNAVRDDKTRGEIQSENSDGTVPAPLAARGSFIQAAVLRLHELPCPEDYPAAQLATQVQWAADGRLVDPENVFFSSLWPSGPMKRRSIDSSCISKGAKRLRKSRRLALGPEIHHERMLALV